MANINFNSTTPAPASGYTNVVFASDSSNNVSASIQTPAYIAASNVFTGLNVFSANLGLGGSAARQQLSVGIGLDLYTAAAANSPTVPSIRSNSTGSGAANLYVNAYGTGALGLNYDSGTGGVIFYNGAGSQKASVSSLGVGTFYGVSISGAQAAVRGLVNPGATTLATSGTAGVTSYSYAVIALQADGSTTGPNPNASTSTIATGNATLSATNYISISWTAVPNAVGYNVYRLTSGGTPSSVGKIASAITATTLNDTGLAGDGTTAAAVRAIPNNTGLNITSPLAGNMGGWTTYLPTFTGAGSMTITSTIVTDAQYLVVGPLCYIKIFCTLTLGGTANSNISFTLPVPAVGVTTAYTAMSLQYAASTAYNFSSGVGYVYGSPPLGYFLIGGGTNFTLTTYEFCFSGVYRCL